MALLLYTLSNAISGPLIVNLDCSGSMVSPVPWDTEKIVYNYNLVVKAEDKPPVAVAELISNSHSQDSISFWLRSTQSRFAEISKSEVWPFRVIVIDMSWAMTNAVLQAICNMTLLNYLEACMASKSSGHVPFILIAWCYAHYLHAISTKVKKWIPLKTKKYSPARCFVRMTMAHIARTTELRDALAVFKHLVKVVSSEVITDAVTASLRWLADSFGGKSILTEDEAEEMLLKLEENPDRLKVEIPKADRPYENKKKAIYTSSPFYKEFSAAAAEALENFDKQTTAASEGLKKKIENPYYLPKLINYLLRYYLPYYPLWSRYLQCLLKLGDNPLTNSAIELKFKLTKIETLGKKLHLKVPRYFLRSVEDSQRRLLEYKFDANFPRISREKRNVDSESPDEPSLKMMKVSKEKWKGKQKNNRPPGGLHSEAATANYAQKLRENTLALERTLEKPLQTDDSIDQMTEHEEMVQIVATDNVHLQGSSEESMSAKCLTIGCIDELTEPEGMLQITPTDNVHPQSISEESVSGNSLIVGLTANAVETSCGLSPMQIWYHISNGLYSATLSNGTSLYFMKNDLLTLPGSQEYLVTADEDDSTGVEPYSVIVASGFGELLNGNECHESPSVIIEELPAESSGLIPNLESSQNQVQPQIEDADSSRIPDGVSNIPVNTGSLNKAEEKVEASLSQQVPASSADTINIYVDSEIGDLSLNDPGAIEPSDSIALTSSNQHVVANGQRTSSENLICPQSMTNHAEGEQEVTFPSKFPFEFPDIPKKFQGKVCGFTVIDKDLLSLKPKKWLYDSVLDCFMALMSKAASLQEVEVLTLPCYLLENFSMGLEFDSSYYEPKTLFKDLWLVPTHTSRNHWVLLVVLMRKKIILYLDPLNRSGNVCSDGEERLKILMYLLEKAHQGACGSQFPWDKWSFYSPKDVALQKNGVDCGVYLCLYAYALCKGINSFKVPIDRVRNWLATLILLNSSERKERSFKTSNTEFANQFYHEYDGMVHTVFKPWKDITLPTIKSWTPEGRPTVDVLVSFLEELCVATAIKCGAPRSCKLPRATEESMILCEICREWYHKICIGDIGEGSNFEDKYLCPLHRNNSRGHEVSFRKPRQPSKLKQ